MKGHHGAAGVWRLVMDIVHNNNNNNNSEIGNKYSPCV
jgi:hypothetical protein